MRNSPESQAPTKPLYISIGEQHDDFSNVSLVHQLLKSCEENGLTVAFYSEDDSQLQKMGRFTDDATHVCGADNLPANWKEIADAVDNNPAHNKNVRLLGSGRVQTVFDPFLCPIAGVVTSNEGNFTGATGAFSEVIEKITDRTVKGFIGINPAFLPLIKSKVEAIQEAGYNIDDPKNFGHYVKETDPSFLLSSLIANHMAGEIKKQRGNEKVVIILTGLDHTENVATELGIPKSEMVVISNCKNEFAKDGYLKGVDVMTFEVDEETKMPIIPSSVAAKLTELQRSKSKPENVTPSSSPAHEIAVSKMPGSDSGIDGR